MSPTGQGSSDHPAIRTSALADRHFESLPIPDSDILDGAPQVRFTTLHQTVDGSVWTGVVLITPGTLRYPQPIDETDYVIAGRMRLSIEGDSDIRDCTPGTVLELRKGVTYIREILEAYEEIFVVYTA